MRLQQHQLLQQDIQKVHALYTRRVSETVGETNILVENDEAEIYYFTGQYPENCADAGLRALTAVQGCRLYAEDDKLCCVR